MRRLSRYIVVCCIYAGLMGDIAFSAPSPHLVRLKTDRFSRTVDANEETINMTSYV